MYIKGWKIWGFLEFCYCIYLINFFFWKIYSMFRDVLGIYFVKMFCGWLCFYVVLWKVCWFGILGFGLESRCLL